MSKFIEEYKESNRTIGILAFLMPPLAVILRNGKIKNRSVLVTFILTLMFWLPGNKKDSSVPIYNTYFYLYFYL